MPPKRIFHCDDVLSGPSPKRSHKNRVCRENPQVVIAPLMRDISSQRKYRFTTLSPTAALFQKEDYSDVTIAIGTETEPKHSYFAHRCILSAASDVFAAMLRSDWQEGSSNMAELCLIEDLECVKVFERFLYFIYSGTVTISESFVIPLFVLADKYNIKSLCEECIKVIENGLKVFNVVQTINEDNYQDNFVSGEVKEPIHMGSKGFYVTAGESSDSSDESSEEDAPTLINNASNPYVVDRSRMLPASDQSWLRESMPETSSSRVTKLIPSETFPVASVLRLLNYSSVHRVALSNLEARVGNQISQENYYGIWKDLESDVVLEILSDLNFKYREYQLFVAAKRWIEAKPERMEDAQLMKELFECIRFPQMTIMELYQAERDPIAKQYARKHVIEAMRYKLFNDRVHPEDIERENWIGSQFESRSFDPEIDRD